MGAKRPFGIGPHAPLRALIPPDAFQRPYEHCPLPQGMTVFWKSHFAPELERTMLGQKLPQNAVITRRVYEIEPIVIASRDEV